MTNYTESEIVKHALIVIEENPGITTSVLISKLRIKMKPDGTDLVINSSRSDDKFSQKVRNIKSHNTIQGLVYTEGTRNRSWYIKQQK